MARHKSSKSTEKNNVNNSLYAMQQGNSSYQSLTLWMSFLLGLMTLGLCGQRFSGVIPTATDSQKNLTTPTHNDVGFFSLTEIQFPGLTPLVLCGAVAYQSGNPFLGLLSSWPLLFATPAVAQTPGLRTVVPEFRVNNSTFYDQSGAATTRLRNEEWVAVWVGEQTARYEIYAQRFAASGSRIGSEFRVNINGYIGFGPAVACFLPTGEWWVVWAGRQNASDYQNIYGKRFAGNGTALGVEFLVNTNTTSGHFHPAVTSLKSGEWVVVWMSDQTNYNIYGQLYTANGTALGTEFRVSSNLVGNKYDPEVTSLPSGEWMAVWDDDQFTGNHDIYARWFAGNGTALGSEFRVNTNTTGYQSAPDVKSLVSGEWMVVWQGRQTGSDDIYAQRYGDNGTALGGEFRVNTVTVGNQQYPTIASSDSGELIVAWTGDQLGNKDVYAQRYSANGSALGDEFRVNTNTTSDQSVSTVAYLASDEWVVAWSGSQAGTIIDNEIYATIFSRAYPVLTTALSTSSSTSAFTSFLPSTVMSTLTTQASMPSTLTTDSSATTQAIMTTTTSSGGMTSTVVTLVTTSQMPNTSLTTTPLIATPTGTSLSTGASDETSLSDDVPSTSGETVVPAATLPLVSILAAAGGGFGLAACLGAIGFYAYRKKARANNTNNNTAENNREIPLQDRQPTQKPTQNPSQEYSAFPPLANKAGSGTLAVALDTNRMSEYASFRAPTEKQHYNNPLSSVSSPISQYVNAPTAPQSSHYSNNIPPVPTGDPYAGFKFENQEGLNQMNREVDEHNAQQQHTGSHYKNLPSAPMAAMNAHYENPGSLTALNREMEEHKAQQALHQTYDNVTVLAPKK